jgi:hypothetical protein
VPTSTPTVWKPIATPIPTAAGIACTLTYQARLFRYHCAALCERVEYVHIRAHGQALFWYRATGGVGPSVHR